jgi:hypothetical protein
MLPIEFHFKNSSNWEKLESDLNLVMKSTESSMNPFFFKNLISTLSLRSSCDFSIIDVSYRVALLLGLYHCDVKTLKAVEKAENRFEIEFPSAPFICLGNIMYLVSKHVNVVGANDNDSDLKLSFAYKYGDILYPGVPVISRREGYWIYCLAEDLSAVEFQLVDFQFHPIIIKNPIHLSIQVEFGGDVF